MGILNDMATRDIAGTQSRETLSSSLYELYPGCGNGRIVKIGEYRSMSYNIITRGTYPCVDIMFGPARMKCGDMVIGDRDGNDRIVSISKISPLAGLFLARISYNGPEDYIRDSYESGKVHTLKSITDDTEWFIDRMLEKDCLYTEECLKDIYRPDCAKKFKKV